MMDDESIEFLVTGESERRSRGLVACSLVCTDRYDHNRNHKDKNHENAKAASMGIMYRKWDFYFGVTMTVASLFTPTIRIRNLMPQLAFL